MTASLSSAGGAGGNGGAGMTGSAPPALGATSRGPGAKCAIHGAVLTGSLACIHHCETSGAGAARGKLFP